MSYLYLLLNIGSIAIPFAFSFHPKLKFYRYLKALAVSIPTSMLLFIPWDIVFTNHGIWGFNTRYITGIEFVLLPLEEWLFFICIPYACIFTHYALKKVNLVFLGLSLNSTRTIGIILVLLFILLAILNVGKWYTLINFLVAAVLLSLVVKSDLALLRQYFFTYVVILFPFFVINGVLTGSFIEQEVVWYNDLENLGIRLGTIPIEDTVYAFSLILFNLFIIERIKR